MKPSQIKKILGSGDSNLPSQTFKLPPDFSLTDLQVMVNNSFWQRVNSFDKSRPTDQVYILSKETGEILFGDGIHGARLPTGRSNVVASYRAGTGKAVNKPSKKPEAKSISKIKVNE